MVILLGHGDISGLSCFFKKCYTQTFMQKNSTTTKN